MSGNLDEELVMQAFLDKHPCRCGAKTTLNGNCYYTNPLLYGWTCANGHGGTVGWTTLQETEIEIHQN